MNFSEIDIEQTHIRLTSDLNSHDLKRYVYFLRQDLKAYISRNPDFAISLEALEYDEDAPQIVKRMIRASNIAEIGPMACVAGTVSEMSLDYLIGLDSKYSVVENGGDIALINDKKLLCGIYSNNKVLGNSMAFEIKARKEPLGICTSSGRIGHSISFGEADCVSVISKSASVADGLATRIANEVKGENSEDKVYNAIECCENYREFFEGVLVISDYNVATLGKLPKIVETGEFNVKI